MHNKFAHFWEASSDVFTTCSVYTPIFKLTIPAIPPKKPGSLSYAQIEMLIDSRTRIRPTHRPEQLKLLGELRTGELYLQCSALEPTWKGKLFEVLDHHAGAVLVNTRDGEQIFNLYHFNILPYPDGQWNAFNYIVPHRG